MKAVPRPGYKFVRWEGSFESNSNTISITPEQELYVNPVFEINSLVPKIVINEINYNSHPNFDSGDWIELYNNENYEVELPGYYFMDSDNTHKFTLRGDLSIPSHGYFVLCQDTSEFNSVFGSVAGVYGNFDFGLGNERDEIRLFNSANEIIDSVKYEDSRPWPSEPDGGGHTISLLDVHLENENPLNWSFSSSIGTPGQLNDAVVAVDSRSEKYSTTFALHQNYPNPFNPKTIIKYEIPNMADVRTGDDLDITNSKGSSAGHHLSLPQVHVKLTVYDILGREIKTLVNEYQSPGTYKVEFNGGSLASGVYIYQLLMNENRISRKMILMR